MSKTDNYAPRAREAATATRHTVLVDLFYVEDERPLGLRQPSGKACRVFGGATCGQGCNLVGGRILVAAADGRRLVDEELVAATGNVARTRPFTLRMPEQPGEDTWKLSYIPPAPPPVRQMVEREPGDALPGHERVDYELRPLVVPHSLGLSVSGFRSPVPVGSEFDIVIGTKCNGGCDLSGLKAVVLDEDGTRLASALLGKADRQAKKHPLYSATVTVRAPTEAGICRWKACVYGDALKPPHADAEQGFFFTATDSPFRKIRAVITDRETSEPVHQASVSFVHGGWVPFEQRTDMQGVAEIRAPDGEYQVSVAKVGYPINRVTVVVSEDTAFFEIPLRGEAMGG
jgi:hypothetical protein